MGQPGGPRVVILGKPISAKAMEMAAAAGVEVIPSNAYLDTAELEEFFSRHQPDGVILRLGKSDPDWDAAYLPNRLVEGILPVNGTP